jgi:hypothetical protein
LMAKAVALIALPLVLLGLAGGASGASRMILVDVRPDAASGGRVVMVVPLALIRAGVALVPEDAARVSWPELARARVAAARAMADLRQATDGELVHADGQGEGLSIRKLGDELNLEVRSADCEVKLMLGMDVLEELLQRYDGRGFHVRDFVAALGKTSRGQFLTAREGDGRLKVWIL